MKPMIHLLGATVLLAISVGGSGCVLARKGAAKLVTPVAMELADGFMRQTDVELVREGAPAFLLMLDALAEAHPDKPAVLIAAAEAQMAYAMGFLDKSQKDRAKAMFLKAKTYGLRALSRNQRFARSADGTHDEFVRALGALRKKDADALLATATSWVMWIIASSDSPAALGDMPKVLAMMERVKELDPKIRQGGVDLFYGLYYTVLPLGGGRDLPKARRHFERSLKIAGPDYLLNRVTFAEYYARYAFDAELFERTLRDVLAAEPDVPEYTLMNAVAKARARALLARMDDLF
ncbi:MAG: hypothetical protein EOL90_00710 [Spartobacteria bacterium]|nr:hypothetical protein [Spartobacteria bacterium]